MMFFLILPNFSFWSRFSFIIIHMLFLFLRVFLIEMMKCWFHLNIMYSGTKGTTLFREIECLWLLFYSINLRHFIEHRIGRSKLVCLNTANWYGTETLNWKIESRLEIFLQHWDSDSDNMHGEKPIQKYLKCLLCIDWLFFLRFIKLLQFTWSKTFF